MSHPLQEAITSLATHLEDAWNIQLVSEERREARAKERKEAGKSGGGPPDVFHKALNRAIVLAAVGAWEAFNEELAAGAQAHDSTLLPPNKGWMQIAGNRGMVQTPNSDNVRKMYWLLCKYDPMPDWLIKVYVSPKEVNAGTSTWRTKLHEHKERAAANFLDTMLLVRHGLAHQDRTKSIQAIAGMSAESASGQLIVNSHHAFNAMRCIVQMAIQTAHGLSSSLGITASLRWVRALDYWEPLIERSAAGELVVQGWRNPPAIKTT